MFRLHTSLHAVVWLFFLSPGLALPAERTNFVVIFCDDLGYGDLGCFGHPTIRTPHLDRLAREGQKWTSFYVGASVCTPSRAALLTGRLPIRNGMMSRRHRVLFPDSTGGLPSSEVTIAELLKSAGYATAAIGKWHLGHLPEFLPTEHGFDTYWGIPYSNDMDAQEGFPSYEQKAQEDPNYVAPIEQYQVPLIHDKTVIERPANQHTITARYTEKTIEFIRAHRDRSFFVYLAHNLPHIPLYAGETHLGKSRRGLYGDVVEEIDAGVGKIAAVLEELDLAKKTLVVFTSDNGPWLPFASHSGSAGLLREGKGTTFEGGMREPTLFWWPGTVKPGVQRELGTTMDLLPTFCRLAGVDIPQDRTLDGVDLSDFLLGKTTKGPRDAVYYWREEELYAVRSGPWKLHFITEGCYEIGPERQKHEPPILYNLEQDPSEAYEVGKRHPDVVARLAALAEQHKQGVERQENQLDQRGKLTSLEERSREKPNIVFIMADDLGYGDVKCYNADSKIDTPNIDRLAREGMRFTDAHSPSAVCTPTRYGLLTGRYCWRTWLKSGVIEGDGSPLIEPGELTVASVLREQGYRSASIGKWHLGVGWTYLPGKKPPKEKKWRSFGGEGIDYSKPLKFGPTDLGFDYFYGTPGCATDDDAVVFSIENKTILGNPQRKGRNFIAERWRHEDVDTTFTQKAIEFIDDHQANAPQGPFFLYLPLSVPHVPWLPPEFVKGKSQAGPRGDQVALADWIVGKIVETLEKHDLTDDTLLVFTSDNGPRRGVNRHRSAGELRGYKSHAWEGGHRVPFIARWPGKIKAGTTSDEVICLVDIMRTFAAIVGAELPKDAAPDSYNVLPALLGETFDRPLREATVLHSVFGAFVVRQGPWKLILGTRGSGGWVAPPDAPPVEGAPGQLYNLADDPAEERNLWDERPDEVKRLAALLEKYKRQGHSQPER